MARARVFKMKTHKDHDNLVTGFSWEIITEAAVILSRRKLDSKTNTMISLKRHAKNFLGINQIDPRKVRLETIVEGVSDEG
jgi:hypothetical protein